jgi:hypothetical protein
METITRILYQITLANICAGIIVEDGIIVQTAPVLAWMRLKRMEAIGRASNQPCRHYDTGRPLHSFRLNRATSTVNSARCHYQYAKA